MSERDAFSVEAQRSCSGGGEAHLAQLDANGECPWCGAYSDALAAQLKLDVWRVEQLVCLEAQRDASTCSGDVELRESLSGTGKPIPRCDGHWSARLDEQQRINARYAPFSDVPPSGFDPIDAGERWDDDY